LRATVRAHQTLEKGPKGCRELRITVASGVDTKLGMGTARSAAAFCRNAPLAWP